MRGRKALVVAAGLLAVIAHSGVARADFGFRPGEPTIQLLDSSGEPYSLAGGHPDRVLVTLGLNENEEEEVEGNARDLSLDFPPGFSGDPTATPTCARNVFEASTEAGEECDPETQVGVIKGTIIGLGELETPIFNLEPAPGQLAVVASALVGKFDLVMRLRPDDLGLRIETNLLGQALPAGEAEIELWGVPADHQEGSTAPRRPFLTLPARCDQGPLTLTAHADSWQEPGRWVTATGSTETPLSGCEDLAFEPAMSFRLASTASDSPSGATLDLTMPQNSEADGRATAAISDVVVTLPEGVSVSPGAVAGLQVCTDAELGLNEERPAECPPASRVGTIELEAPQLSAPLRGDVYLGREKPGERFRLFLVAERPGVPLKLTAVIEPEPETGRLVVSLRGLPSIGFGRMELKFDDGPTALLTTPIACGEVVATASFQRYGEFPATTASSGSRVDSGAGGRPCSATAPFSPELSAGTTTRRAGRPSGLSLTVRRDSGEELVDRLDASFPPGVAADFGAVAPCSADAAREASCPEESRVGSAIAAVGVAANPAVIGGDVYLTGPYRGAPFGLALAFHAALGSFDLGTFVLRATLRVDPANGRLSVRTDSLPGSIEGVPLRFRLIGMDVDRPGFVRTPTSCRAMAVEAGARSAAGAESDLSSPFELGGCNSLGFAPRVSVALSGAGQMRKGGRPGLEIALRSRPGRANLRSVDIALPGMLRRDLGGLRGICSRTDAGDGRCPAGSSLGTVRAVSPLFRHPASGPVSLVQPPDNGPPEIWATLYAEGARLSVRGKVFSRHGHVHARLLQLPDLPFSRMALRLNGGRHGLLSLGRDPCPTDRKKARVRSALEAQNQAFLIRRGRIRLLGCGRDGRGRSIEAARRLG